MPVGMWIYAVPAPAPPKIGRPRRDRRKIAASRRTARRNRK